MSKTLQQPAGAVQKVSYLGAIVGCASCFLLLGTMGAAIGLGFLGQFEGILINKLLPAFAGIAMLSTIAAWLSHRKNFRLLAGLAEPSMILATLYLFWTDNWSTYMFYLGLILMLVVALWDIVFPASRQCNVSQVIK
ncbi:MAG: MerC family mercury resistance protein [Gammaproteobacteria bacterium]|nr:MerC family mercury resistance protein [Gammaproteobacteria bacterium]